MQQHNTPPSDDEQHDSRFCEVCGCELEYEECDACGGDGYRDWMDLQFEDPLWYQPGDTERCGVCHGHGGWLFCPNVSQHKQPAEEAT
jgi:hypothetical protein